MIVERLGPLTYLVPVDSGVFWHRHIDHLHPAPDKISEPDRTFAPNLSVQPDLPGPSEFISVVDSEQSAQGPEQLVSVRRYPQRQNHRPPTRYNS